MKKTKNSFRLPIVDAWKDFKNYLEWIKIIKNERDDPNSLYNKYDIKHNFFYNIYLGITLPQEDSVLPSKIKRMRVVESLAAVHRYIDVDLGFAEYIVPEFNQVVDDEGNETLTYVIVYRFAFKKLSLMFIIKRLLILGGVYLLATKLPWEKIYTWISSLM